ncbi:hypothetical protein E5D57_007519 [Metarhizium anisopliae]|nr:hypothetical protein E5D57_007519 [Metarhizium anisopliae]
MISGIVIIINNNNKFQEDLGDLDPVTGAFVISAGGQTLMYGLLLTGAILASMVSGPVGTKYGRGTGLSCCAGTYILGPVVQILSPNIGVHTFGRVVTGVGVGFAANFCGCFINAAAFAGASIIQVRGTTWPPAELDREIDDTAAMFGLERSLEGSTTYRDCFRNTDARSTRIILMFVLARAFTVIPFIAGHTFLRALGHQEAVSGSNHHQCPRPRRIDGSLPAGWHDRTAPAPPLFTGSISCGLCMLLFAIVGAANILAACARVYLFAYGATIAGTIWLYFELPETKDRTLEGVDDMFLNANCTGPVHISRRWLPLIQCHYYFVLCALAQVFPSQHIAARNSDATSAPAKSDMVTNGRWPR